MNERQLNIVTGNIIRNVRTLRREIEALSPFEDRAKGWRLFSGYEYGGIYCAEPDCGCEAEGSQIIGGSYGHEGDADYDTFTLDKLHHGIVWHIEQRAAIKAEEKSYGEIIVDP